MRELGLSNSTRKVLVDDEDYFKLLGYTWNLDSNKNHAQGMVAGVTVDLHSLILPLKEGFIIDHRDRNGLNNQKYNLRYATASQQRCNVDIYKNNSSGYKGVSWHSRLEKWGASIQINHRRKHLGYFSIKKDAAIAYNEAAKKFHGEFAVLNSIAA